MALNSAVDPTSRLYLRRARAFATAAEHLATMPELGHPAPTVVLVHHAVELALKAVSIGHGADDNDLRRSSHDLASLLDAGRMVWPPTVRRRITFLAKALKTLRYPRPDRAYLPDVGQALRVMRYVVERCARHLSLSHVNRLPFGAALGRSTFRP